MTNNNDNNNNKNWYRKQNYKLLWQNCPEIERRINMRATRTAIATAAVVTKDLVIVRETMKMILEDVTGTVIDLAIVPATIPWGRHRGSRLSPKQPPRGLEQ